MASYLNRTAWLDELVSSTGKRYFRVKRVSAQREQQFPRKYRALWCHEGPGAVVKLLMKEHNYSLSAAWSNLKLMARIDR